MLDGLLGGHRHQYVEQPLRQLPHVLENPHIAAAEGFEDDVKLVRRKLVEHAEQLVLE